VKQELKVNLDLQVAWVKQELKVNLDLQAQLALRAQLAQEVKQGQKV
jgi:hypothetical protein